MTKLKELLHALKNDTQEEFCKKYTVVEEAYGYIERDINPFTFEENGSIYEDCEYNYKILDSDSNHIFEGYFLDTEELIESLEDELGIEAQ